MREGDESMPGSTAMYNAVSQSGNEKAVPAAADLEGICRVHALKVKFRLL